MAAVVTVPGTVLGRSHVCPPFSPFPPPIPLPGLFQPDSEALRDGNVAPLGSPLLSLCCGAEQFPRFWVGAASRERGPARPFLTDFTTRRAF